MDVLRNASHSSLVEWLCCCEAARTTQERLGAWLQGRFEKEDTDLPTIICTGAAIAFLTGEQIQIPKWADRLFLGWAMRCIDKPALYIPRYFKSIPVLYYALKDALGKN